MQLKEFFNQYQSDLMTLKKYPVIIFCSGQDDATPIVFASQFISFLKVQNFPIESLDLTVVNQSNALSQLETSFLGMGMTYWLRGIHDVDKKYRHTILEYLATYQGPHQIILFVNQDDSAVFSSKKMMTVTIPEAVNGEVFSLLFSFFKKKYTPQIQKALALLCQTYQKISLDQACMIMAYMQVMGRYEDASQLFERILESEKSLFSLSQYFFAKDSAAFFTLWSNFELEYPITFWCTYWSEQLWRAYHARYFLERQQAQQAKSVGYRLPFSYLQKDWKKTNLLELKNAHQFIYELDLAFKNNIETQSGIELFYTKFFLNEF